jgi:hypothetical protein
MRLNILFVHLTTVSFVLADKPCPLLGPAFEAPTDLADAPIFRNALLKLQHTLDAAVANNTTPYGSWPAVNNSFSIGIFNTESTSLFSYQHSAAALAKAEQGVKEVTEDTVYRLGSLSKLITAYLFLIEAGPQWWGHSVTEFFPQLRNASANCVAANDPIDCFDWDHITLGALASHLAGMPRDCECSLSFGAHQTIF